MRAALVLLLLTLAWPAWGASDVVLMYGWGPDGWSSGIDQIARKARTLRGVNATWVGDYSQTQAAHDWLVSRPQEHSLICVGYSCGGNGALVTCGSVNRPTHVIMLQPSVWCGRHGTTPNMHVQDTWSSGNFGLALTSQRDRQRNTPLSFNVTTITAPPTPTRFTSAMRSMRSAPLPIHPGARHGNGICNARLRMSIGRMPQ